MIRSLFLLIASSLILFSVQGMLSAQDAVYEGPKLYILPDSAVTAEQRELIEKAIPDKAPVQPKKSRKLLIYDVNADYGGHGSIPHANLAFKLMGEKTGAFETTVSRDPQVFEWESLNQYDAIFFNNNVGNIFTDQALRDNIALFVRRGGGLMGVHGTTGGFMNFGGPNAGTDDWPEFGEIIGGRGTYHREMDEKIYIKVEEPDHPLLQCFPKEGFPYQDEFFRVHGPYSREKQRVLLSIWNEKSNLDREPYKGAKEREDEDYALAWVKNYGNGRSFYCTLAHSPKNFWEPKLLEFYLAAAQFVLGDLDASALPSAAVSDTIRTHERLGWKLVMPAYTFHQYSLFDNIDKTKELGMAYCGGLTFQKVGGGIDKNLMPDLSDEEIEAIRQKLQSSGVRMASYFYGQLPSDEAACRKVFEFAEKLGAETIIDEPKPESLDMIEKLCDEFGINVALHNHAEADSPHYWSPAKVLEQCKNRGSRIGVCCDLGYWMRSGIDPVEAVKILKNKIRVVQVHDLVDRTPNGTDVPWGTGAGKTKAFFEELAKQGVRPVDVDLEYSDKFEDNMAECRKCIDFFNKTVKEIVNQ